MLAFHSLFTPPRLKPHPAYKEKLLRRIHSQMDFSLLNADEFSVVP
jgi:hypothetical protein